MKTILALGLATVAAPAAMAQKLPEHMVRMDTDKDGKVSLAEFSADRAKLIRTLDADKNGLISREEATAHYVKIAPAEDPKTVKRIADATGPDANGDGTSLAELMAARAADFRKRDKNGDGFITADEA